VLFIEDLKKFPKPIAVGCRTALCGCSVLL
jgi:hypothetical protein